MLAAGMLVPVIGVGSAHAAGSWNVNLSVHQNGAADLSVTDSLSGASYLVTLTAAGGGTCSLLAGAGEVADAGIGTNSTSTQGSCDLYNATVNYVMTWTVIGGGSGQVPVQCVWALGKAPICTPKSFSGHLVSGVID